MTIHSQKNLYLFPKTIFFPWIHSNEYDNVKFLRKYKNEHIVFLDYCPKKEYLSNDNKYLIIDHHHNAINNIQETENIKMYCDTERSGCMLTWDYCYPKSKYPLPVKYIGERDISCFGRIDRDIDRKITNSSCHLLIK